MSKLYWCPEIETQSPVELRKHEESLLAPQIERIYALSPYYRRKLDQENIKPEAINSFAALSQLPFTEKSDFVKEQANGELFGDNQCVPFEKIVRVVGTGGSSGTPLRLGWTRRDITSYSEMGARALWAMGCRPDDMVINCFNYSIYAGGVMDHSSFEHLGAGILPYGIGQSDRLLNMIANLPGNHDQFALYATPSYALRLADLAQERDLKLSDCKINKGFFSGEPGLQLPGYREKIESAWGMSASDLYGTAEVGVQSGECKYRNGLHYCGGGHVAVELIDSDSGQVKEMADGETGELVFTTLIREACPLLRLRTHDTVRVFTEPCACGRTSFRFLVLGRNDDMFIVKGVNVFPLSIQETLLSQQPAVSGEFFVILDEAPPIDYAPKVYVELGSAPDSTDYASLAKSLSNSIRQHSNFSPEIILVEKGVISSEHKTKRLYRTYNGESSPEISQSIKFPGVLQ